MIWKAKVYGYVLLERICFEHWLLRPLREYALRSLVKILIQRTEMQLESLSPYLRDVVYLPLSRTYWTNTKKTCTILDQTQEISMSGVVGVHYSGMHTL